MIQSPVVLAELPRSLVNGRNEVHAADVYGFDGDKKRKRSEIAVAVDGECVNVYDVRSSNLVTGYTVSTQSSFTCPPCSVREKSTRQRWTYCAVQDPKPKLLCFTEKAVKGSISQGPISTSSLDLRGSSSPVVHLGTINSTSSGVKESGHALLALHKNGHLRCISQNLSEEYWKTAISHADDQQETEIKAATLITVAQARKTLLKNREDLLASIDASFEFPNTSQSAKAILLVISHNGKTLYLRLFCTSVLQPSTSNAVHLKPSTWCEEIVSCEIPVPTDTNIAATNFSLSEGGGSLYHIVQKSLVIYNLLGAMPQREGGLELSEEISSCVRLSSSEVILTSPTSISILNPRYRSFYDTRILEKATDKAGNTTTLSVSNGTTVVGTQLISYFPSLDAVIGLQGRLLVAFHVADANLDSPQSMRRPRSGALINAVRRGINISRTTSERKVDVDVGRTSLRVPVRLLRDSRAWNEKKMQLNIHAANSNAEKFDDAMILEFKLELLRNGEDEEGLMSKNEYAVQNQDKSEEKKGFKDLNQSPSKGRFDFLVDHSKVQYALSKIFVLSSKSTAIKQNESPGLTVALYPPKTFACLAENGHICSQQVESAMKHSCLLPVTISLKDAAVIEAISVFDKSLAPLDLILQGPTLLKPQELVSATRAAMQAIHLSGNQRDSKLLTNGAEDHTHTMSEDGDVDMIDGAQEGVGLTIPEYENATRFDEIMRRCLRRLYACHEGEIRQSLKEVMNTNEMIALIDYLRIQIGQGGWLARYVDDLQGFVSGEHFENDQLRILTKLFNCTIDALGPGGWILDGYELLGSGDNLAYMKAEISAALEGIEEAAYLQGMLGEILLYSKNAPAVSRTPKKIAESTKPLIVSLEEAQANVLPLGLKGPPRISSTKIGAGGEIQTRSVRDIARLKSRQVGKYSFERIVL
ncbi:MAG: hypothetical protein MMC33_008402 [Icmadophila ericetorum]|nr:hypothetical protein [Icmadophila ericetorum]